MLKLDDVIAALNDTGVPSDKVAQVRKELEKIEQEKKDERDSTKGTRAKSEFVVILFDKDGKIPVKTDFTAAVVQIEEGQAPAAALDKVKIVARAQNTTVKKFIKNPIKTVADAFANIKPKFAKQEKIKVKTKEPVLVIVSDNTL